jgi:hypothetical protein
VGEDLMIIFRAISFPAIFLAVLGLGLAACGTPKPQSAPAHSTAAHTSAVSYRDVESLVAAMAVHGAVCGNVQFTSSTMPGGLSPHVGCDGISSGDTSVVVFTDHGSALTFARNLIQSDSSLGPMAEVVGPDWVVNTVPAFARQVMHAVGGQLLTPANTHAAVGSTVPVTPEVAADKAMCKTFNANIGNGGESQIAQALLAAGTLVSSKLLHDITKAITATSLNAGVRAQVNVAIDCGIAAAGTAP